MTGESSPAGQWRIRNLVAWVRPNPPVGALGDKFRPATSYVTVATLARDRWFDLDAVRTQPVTDLPPAKGNNTKGSDDNSHRFAQRINNAPGGAPPLDWWNITPGGYTGAHYAVFPMELPKRLIDSMCPRKVCTTCGQPSRRIVETTGGSLHDHQDDEVFGRNRPNPRPEAERVSVAVTLGWSDCGHGTWRPGHVLDPFAGSGTTLAVATGMARNSTGIDLDHRNADLARDRVGMFLDIDHGTTQAAS